MLRPCPEMNNTGVNMYIDECGILKGLPVNRRATELAHVVGKGTQNFHGDIYMGRFRSPPEGLLKGPRHVDFTLEDMATSSKFRIMGKKLNIEDNFRQQKMMESIKKIGKPIGDDADHQSYHTNKKDVVEGAGCEVFTWRQNFYDVEISIPVHPGTRTKDCNVVIESRKLSVFVATNDKNMRDTELELMHPIQADDATWTLTSQEGGTGRTLNLHMDKIDPCRWMLLEKTIKIPERFVWSQTPTEVTITTELVPHIKKHQLNVIFEPQNVTAVYHGQAFFRFEKLQHNISRNEGTWQFIEGDEGKPLSLQITMQKEEPGEWQDIGQAVDPSIIQAITGTKPPPVNPGVRLGDKDPPLLDLTPEFTKNTTSTTPPVIKLDSMAGGELNDDQYQTLKNADFAAESLGNLTLDQLPAELQDGDLEDVDTDEAFEGVSGRSSKNIPPPPEVTESIHGVDNNTRYGGVLL